MKTYIGTKVIDAEPMTRYAYNEYRGLPIPQNADEEGYHVLYADGYESWSPKEVFENTYRLIGDVSELEMDLLRTKYTKVFVENEFTHNAPNQYFVADSQTGKGLCYIHFQDSEFECRENAVAITKLEEALLWLRKRTIGREKRGVEGTHIV